jgi:hypothetical protein
MKRQLLAGAFLTVVLALGLGGTALADSGGSGSGSGSDNIPAKCLVMKDGVLPTCLENSNGTWTADYSDGSDPTDPGAPSGSGIPSGFVVLFVLFAIGGIGVTIWRISSARSMARNAGMDPDTATAVTLFGSPGLDATYLAASIRAQQHTEAPPPAAPAAAAPAPRSSAERLQELTDLHTKGLLTNDEYEKRRREIVDSI